MIPYLARHRDLLTVLFTALAARALVPIVANVFHHSSYFLVTDDSYEYVRLAESLTVGTFAQNGVVDVLRTPGYPLLVTLGVFAGHPIGLTIVLQVILGSVAAVLVYALAHGMAEFTGCRDSRQIAFFAGLFYALAARGRRG